MKNFNIHVFTIIEYSHNTGIIYHNKGIIYYCCKKNIYIYNYIGYNIFAVRLNLIHQLIRISSEMIIN